MMRRILPVGVMLVVLAAACANSPIEGDDTADADVGSSGSSGTSGSSGSTDASSTKDTGTSSSGGKDAGADTYVVQDAYVADTWVAPNTVPQCNGSNSVFTTIIATFSCSPLVVQLLQQPNGLLLQQHHRRQALLHPDAAHPLSRRLRERSRRAHRRAHKSKRGAPFGAPRFSLRELLGARSVSPSSSGEPSSGTLRTRSDRA